MSLAFGNMLMIRNRGMVLALTYVITVALTFFTVMVMLKYMCLAVLVGLTVPVSADRYSRGLTVWLTTFELCKPLKVCV